MSRAEAKTPPVWQQQAPVEWMKNMESTGIGFRLCFRKGAAKAASISYVSAADRQQGS